ncbi:hypothetical protein JCM5296_002246 [Sporobolomyces johnsonii]
MTSPAAATPVLPRAAAAHRASSATSSSSPHAGASSSDYVLPPNQAWAPFTKTRTVLLPDRLFEEHDLTQSRCTMGLLPEIGRSWVTVDHRLLLWDWADGEWVVLTNMGANVVSRQRPVDTLLDAKALFFEGGGRPVSIDRGGYGSGPQGQASDSKIIFSGRHEGLAFYFVRLIRPIWKQITRPSPSTSDPSRQGTNVPDVVLSAVQRDLIALRSFVEQEHLLFTHVPDSSRSSPNSAAYQAEQASLASLRLLLTQSVEAISFILLLNDYQLPEIAASCASERQLCPAALALHALERPRLDLTCLKELHVPTSLMTIDLIWLENHTKDDIFGILSALPDVKKDEAARQHYKTTGRLGVESQIRPEFVTNAEIYYSTDLLISLEQGLVTVLCGPAHAMLLMTAWHAHRDDSRGNPDIAFLALYTLRCLKTLHTLELSVPPGNNDDRFKLSPDHFRAKVRQHEKMLHLARGLLSWQESSWFAKIDIARRIHETPEQFATRKLEAQIRTISPWAKEAAAWENKKWTERMLPRTEEWLKQRAADYQDMFIFFHCLLRYALVPGPPVISVEEEKRRLAGWRHWAKTNVPTWRPILAEARAGQDQHGDASHSLAKPEYVPQARTGWTEATRRW